MIRIYRQSTIRSRYPSSTFVLEMSGEVYITIKNPLSRDWWRTWVLNPLWKGARWRGIREGLTLVRVGR